MSAELVGWPTLQCSRLLSELRVNDDSDLSSLFHLGERAMADQWAVPGGLNKGQAPSQLLIVTPQASLWACILPSY